MREVEHLDFVDAVERLASRAGITAALRRHRDRQGPPKQRERLREAVAAAIDFYHELLLERPTAAWRARYLRSRGFDGDAARQFQLGWSPDGVRRC